MKLEPPKNRNHDFLQCETVAQDHTGVCDRRSGKRKVP